MSQVYEYVTERIIDLLDKAEEKGECAPWLKPWDPTKGFPKNGFSSKPYRGINVLLTSFAPFGSNLWFSYKQVKTLGGTVKESAMKKHGGEGPTMISFFKFMDKDKNDKKAGKFGIFKYYNVWNLEQTKNIKVPKKSQEELKQFEDINSVEDLLTKTPVRPQINHGGSRACYIPSLDTIKMPEKGSFDSSEGYYGTLLHELVHSTAHPDRLNRDLSGFFGNDKYSFEEILAEIGSVFLCGITGIEKTTIDNSAAYIRNWRKKLSQDSKLIVRAASKAQRATDLICGVSFSNDND